jgi:conjugal transfer ATP-binding protein TraC
MSLFSKKSSSPSVDPALEALLEQEKIYQQGLSTVKDLISPAAFNITPDFVKIGNKYAVTHFVHTYPRYLQTNWFSPVINYDMTFDASIFIHPMDSTAVLKTLLKVVTQVQSRIHMEEEHGKIRDPMLETALIDAEGLRDSLQQGTEKFFRLGIYITIYAESKEELEKLSREVEGMFEGQLIYAKPAVFQMEDGFASTLPLAQDKLAIGSNMNTSPLSTIFPFVSSDLTSNRGILYGINRHNNSLVLFDRFSMENANMVVFAKSGAGKSYAVKLEILRSLMFGVDVIVIDPENEYKYLAETVNGAFLRISLTSDHHINPFDLPVPSEDENPADVLKTNVIHLAGLLKVMLGAMTPEEDSLMDRAISETYAIKDITPDSDFANITPPTMTDLGDVLANMSGAESLSLRLKKFTEGTFGGFMNQQTNIKINKSLVVFNIRDMEEQLRPVAMYVILHYIWTLIRGQLKKRILVVDEAWVMMQNEEAASFMYSIAKRCRKYYLGLTTITQDITDFLSSRYGKSIINNSSIQLLLRQSPAAIDMVKDTFYLTDEEKYLLLESNVGEGIFFAGAKHAAIKIVASYSEDQIITSNPEQILEIEKARKELGK